MKPLLLTIIGGSLFLAGLVGFGPLERLSSEVTTRYWEDGKSFTSTSSFYYKLDGTLVVRTEEPENMIIKTNRFGEMYLYFPDENVAEYQQNAELSSESTQFYIFLQGMTDDLGLRTVGYELQQTEFEDGHQITYWNPPEELSEQVGTTKLVHQDYRPVYLSVRSPEDKVIQRTYFHDYTELADREFPGSITTIEYESPEDSTVMQTLFNDIKYNEAANSPYFDFSIPDDATIRSSDS